MPNKDFFDELKPHTKDKLDMLSKYMTAYTPIIANLSWINSIAFVDPYAGCGRYNDSSIKASPLIFCENSQTFKTKNKKAKYYGNDLNHSDKLREALSSFSNDLYGIFNDDAKDFHQKQYQYIQRT